MAGRQAARNDLSGASQATPLGWPDWADPTAAAQLRDAVRAGQVGHALLLSGPAGVGKRALAVALAQTLTCRNVDRADPSQPCGKCRSCRNVARGTHPDVEWFDLETQAMVADKGSAATSLSIETIRRLRASAGLLPLEGSRRLLIIDDAETMQEPAQQALLKTLEEPPTAVTLLLLADEPERLLETVRSRCRHVLVRPVPVTVVERTLAEAGVDPDQARVIAQLSRGCPAWAIQASSDPTLLKVRQQAWDAAQAWLGDSEYGRLVTAYRYGEQFGKRKGEVLGVVQSAAQLLRSEMLRCIQDNDGDASGAEASRAAYALSQGIQASLRCLADLDANVRPRLALESMVVSWPSWESQVT